MVERNANDGYDSPFQPGTLSFKGSVGKNQINPPKQMAITNTTTVLDLITFMEQAFGIQKATAANGIPNDISGLPPGGSLDNGRIRMVGNNGTGNSLEIKIGDLQLVPTSGTATQPNLGFATTQPAVGTSATANMTVYDSLGTPLNVRVTAVLQSIDATTTTYRWFASSSDNDPASGVETAVGTGLISFDGSGNLLPANPAVVSIDRAHTPANKPLNFQLDFSKVSGLSPQTPARKVPFK